MRRLLLSVLFLFVTVATLSAQRADAPMRGVWSHEKSLPPLYGEVDSVIITTFSLKDVFGEVTRVRIEDKLVCTFNSYGDLAVLKLYDSGDELDGLSRFEYDSNRRVLGASLYSASGALEEKMLLKYDSNGRVEALSLYNNRGEMKTKSIYRYNEAGKPVETVKYDSEGSLISTTSVENEEPEKFVCKYDDEGKVLERAIYDAIGGCQWRTIYRYDAVGNIVEETKYETDIMIPRKCVEYIIYYKK